MERYGSADAVEAVLGTSATSVDRRFNRLASNQEGPLQTCPPDKQEQATEPVLNQAKLLCVD